MVLPSLFISHGSPMLALTDAPARDFLRGLGKTLPRPKAILVASAHWETAAPRIGGIHNDTIHDFYGFPQALFDMRYPAPPAPDVATRVEACLAHAGFVSEIDSHRGLDHGAWVPLSLIYPQADIPVLQVSIQPHLGPAHHVRLGRALAPLAREGVLIIGSGSLTHNLSEFRGRALDAPAPEWVSTFGDWMKDALLHDRTADLLNYRQEAPFAVKNHPTDEHLLPLYVAMGASGVDTPHVVQLHDSLTYGILRMDAYSFQASQAA